MMLSEDIAYVGRLIDAYAESCYRMHVAAVDSRGPGAPAEMHAGPVNAEGWVEWRVLPSTLTDAEVVAVEDDFGIHFPPLFRAYLLARFHLLDQVRSRRYDQQIFMPDVPSGRQLQPLRELLRAWQFLIAAELIPFAEWGDGWGPMCFDVQRRASDGDCPIVWLDHEQITPLGLDRVGDRQKVAAWMQPLYQSFREFLSDVFVRP